MEADTSKKQNKRQMEEGDKYQRKKDRAERRKKKQRKEGSAEPSSSKKFLFQRIWSKNDEIVLLEGLLHYSQNKGVDPTTEMDDFLKFIQNSLEFQTTKSQLRNKILRMKKRYQKAPKCFKAQRQEAFAIVQKIWPNKVTDKNACSGSLEEYILQHGLGRVDRSSSTFVELERQWTKLQVDELKVFVERNKLILEYSQLVHEAAKSRTTCMKFEEHQTALAALEADTSLAPGDARFTSLSKECKERIAEETSELPMQSLEDAPTNVVSTEDVPPANDNPDQVPMVASAKPKYRHELYQKPEEVVVTIFAKGIPAESVFVDFGEQILSVTINVPGEDAYHFQPRLFGKIIPDKCRFDVLSTEVEIRLAKVEPIHWTSLEYRKENTVIQRVNVQTVSGSQRPAYPSSKPRRVDWVKIEADVKKEEKEEKLDGDAPLNKFFRDVYQDADEDTKRATRKSFVESNGTVLSTNWKEIGSKKVEGIPPDSMEMKKWEY